MLREVCQAYTDLAPEEIRRLELLADQLPLIAELTAADVFKVRDKFQFASHFGKSHS